MMIFYFRLAAATKSSWPHSCVINFSGSGPFYAMILVLFFDIVSWIFQGMFIVNVLVERLPITECGFVQ